MLSIIFEYNGIKINDVSEFALGTAIALTDVSGLSGNEISVASEKLVDTHKVIDFPGYMSGRAISLGGAVVGKTETLMLSKISEMNKSFSVPVYYAKRTDGYRNLVFYRSGASEDEKYFVSARIKKLPRFDKTLHIQRKRGFFIELFCEDPFIYSVKEKIINFNEDGEINYTLPNVFPGSLLNTISYTANQAGDTPTSAYFKITGSFKSIEIQNNTNGRIISLSSINIPNGEYIEVFGEELKVYKNGLHNIDNDLSANISLSSESLFLEGGDNEMIVRWTDISSNQDTPIIELKYRDTFSNIEI